MPYFRFRSGDRILHVYAADSTTARALARRSGNPVNETGEGIVAVGETLPTGANDITPPLYGGGSADALAAGLDQPTYAEPAAPAVGDFSVSKWSTDTDMGGNGGDGGFAEFTKIGDTTNTGEAEAMAALLANTPAVDPAALSNLNELQRMQGLFRNFARDQGLNATGIGRSAVDQRFAPAQAAQIIGQQLAGQGFQSGLNPDAVDRNFGGFLPAQGGFGNIDQTAGNVFSALLSQSDPSLQNQQFLNPTVLGTGGSFTNDANFILNLARAASRNRIGGMASAYGTPSNEELQTRFQTAPQGNFAQFAANALGVS